MSSTPHPNHFGYETSIVVTEKDIDDLKHVNNMVYLQWAQEVAGAHWFQKASKEERSNYRWIVLRHEIDYLSPAFVGEELTAYTWVEKMEGVRSVRKVEIKREGTILARIITTWVMIDSQTGKLCRISNDMASRFILPGS